MASLLFNASLNKELDERYLKTLRRSIGGNSLNIKSVAEHQQTSKISELAFWIDLILE